jgi:hypothetical protein
MQKYAHKMPKLFSVVRLPRDRRYSRRYFTIKFAVKAAVLYFTDDGRQITVPLCRKPKLCSKMAIFKPKFSNCKTALIPSSLLKLFLILTSDDTPTRSDTTVKPVKYWVIISLLTIKYLV